MGAAGEAVAAKPEILPGGVALPRGESGRPVGLPAANAYCRALARAHYENFMVASVLVPRELRQPMYHVYAYCRWADDLADEAGDPVRGLAGVRWWREELHRCYAGEPRHPVFVALAETIAQFDLPIAPFDDLLTAFEQDQTVTRYQTYQELLGYCRYSANPVGRLVLLLFGCRDEERLRLSDCTCTALQLANFWQDVARDLEKGRIYLPLADMEQFGFSEEELLAGTENDAFRRVMQFQVERTRELFREGEALCSRVPRRLRLQIDMFGQGGLLVLRMIEQRGYNVLSGRPAISKGQQAGLFLRRLWAHLRRQEAFRLFENAKTRKREPTGDADTKDMSGMQGTSASTAPELTVGLAESYRYCRSVARREARNFYYSFMVLPAEKRDAMCAVYAFMRYCDDIADSPGAPATKRGFLDAWGSALEAATRGECASSPILPAFRETVERYAIPPALFRELIEGAAMDLTVRRYATFEELRQYCYRVASVVGLVCIRIFGFADDGGQMSGVRRSAFGVRTDADRPVIDDAGPERRAPNAERRTPPPGAERYAEHLGIAFQLTNILRDIPEDAAMGRIYLPLEDLAAFDYSEAELLAGVADDRFLRLVQFEAERAREYYEMARPLLPMLHPSSRPCLAAMDGIYRGILERIEHQGYNVFAGRARLSAWRKLGVAASSWVRYSLVAR